MIDVGSLIERTRGSALEPWSTSLPAQLAELARERQHGEFSRWLEIIGELPIIEADRVDLARANVGVSCAQPLLPETRAALRTALLRLHPWRKGPYHIHGVDIDTEWRSDWKWARLQRCLGSLAGKRVLDVGCGNGYHCWRMAGAGAELVIGIDPTQLFIAQFLAIQHFLGRHWPVHLLPLSLEELPENLQAFDNVFSMGVFYHRRSPIDHLLSLKNCLRNGGELILETLVIEGGAGEVLVPAGRYAKMRNVWFIPTVDTLTGWIQRCGFDAVRLVDVTPTSTDEQRSTAWMRFESLANFLDPGNHELTVEGYPAPMRAILHAVKR